MEFLDPRGFREGQVSVGLSIGSCFVQGGRAFLRGGGCVKGREFAQSANRQVQCVGFLEGVVRREAGGDEGCQLWGSQG